MVWQNLKEKIFYLAVDLYIRKFLEHGTYFTGIRIPDNLLRNHRIRYIELDLQGNQKEISLFKCSMKEIIQSAMESGAHEAGEIIYIASRKAVGERPHRVLGEFVGDFFEKTILPLKEESYTTIKKIEPPMDNSLTRPYACASVLQKKFEGLPLRVQIAALQFILFGKYSEKMEQSMLKIDKLVGSEGYPYLEPKSS